MAKLQYFSAFEAAIALHKDQGSLTAVLEDIYHQCQASLALPVSEVTNCVKALYAPFTDEMISQKIANLLQVNIRSEVEIIFQKIEDLHRACPGHLGDWYFSGNYPTPGGNRMVNRAFMNFYEGKSARAY